MLLLSAACAICCKPFSPVFGRDEPDPVLPLIPVLLGADCWDHHWFIWLPRHPVYESVEVMMRPGPESEVATWVFFTERAPPKRQISYINVRQLAARNGWILAVITASTIGADDGPLGLQLYLDAPGASTTITLDFAPEQRLSTRGAGLTPQFGHGASRGFLIFWRGLAALAHQSAVLVEGEDVSRPIEGRDDPLPFHAAYSWDILVGSIPFAKETFTFGAQPNLISFSRQAAISSRWIYSATPYAGRRLEIEADAGGNVGHYAAFTRGHRLNIAFSPALPPARSSATGIADFRIDLDSGGTLMTGTVAFGPAGGAFGMEWQVRTPEWAHGTGFRSTVALHDDRTVTVEVRQT